MNITKNLEISQIKRVGPKLVAIFALFAAGANAQNITWQVPQTISGASDVSTLGTYFGSWAPWDGNSTSYPVNGVTFQGNSDLQGLNDWVGKGGGPYFSSPNTPDSNYNSLLPYGQYAPDGTLEVIDWSGMTAGHTYLVQFWVEDSRGGSTAARWETLSGGAIGATSSAIDASAQLAYSNPLNNVTAGNPGSYIIGTFVAGASGSEEILLTPGADTLRFRSPPQ